MFSTLDEKMADPYRDRETTRNGAVSFLTYGTRFYQIVQNVATRLSYEIIRPSLLLSPTILIFQR